MNTHHKLTGLVVLVMMLALASGWYCSQSVPSQSPTPQTAEESPPTVVSPRQIADNTLNLREYWRASHTCIGGFAHDHPPLIAISGRVACLYGDSTDADSTSGPLQLRVFSMEHGDELWRVVGEPGVGYLAADTERIYLVNPLYTIHAYDPDTGQQIWKKWLFPNKASLLYTTGDKLYVLGMKDEEYTIDARTGEVLSRVSVVTEDGFVQIAQYPGFDLYTRYSVPHLTRGLTLRAVDPTTQQTLWLVEDTGMVPLKRRPALLDNVLLVATANEVIAFDARDGHVVWYSLDSKRPEITGFATDSIVVGDYLYALRRDGRLVRWDARTGQELGYIRFTGATPAENTKSFHLAADGQMLFVSFDDTNELIALGP